VDRTRSALGGGGRKPVVGLIGGIGSGKSRVAAEFARRGAVLIAGDQLGHEALRQPAVKEQVRHRWGEGVFDATGEVDRRQLGRLVFADQAELKALEAMTFPWIERGIEQGIRQAQEDPRAALVVLDAAILLEAGWNRYCDRLVYVHAPRARRLARVAAQRGWTAKEVDTRARAQLPLPDKMRRADEVVDNSRSPEETARQVESLLSRWVVAPGPGVPP
jgi:dephospho-CoA kinase